jgi:hypothetical protein
MSWLEKALEKAKKAFSKKETDSSKESCPIKKTGLLIVVMRQDTREAISNAKVDISGPTKQSKPGNSDGVAQFSMLMPGSYEIKVTLPAKIMDLPKEDFEEPEIETEAVSSGNCAIHIIKIKRLATLKVMVSSTKTPEKLFLDGSKIEVKGPGEGTGTTAKGANGWVEIKRLKAGDYTVSSSSLGSYANDFALVEPSTPVTLQPGEVRKLEILAVPSNWIQWHFIEVKDRAERNLAGLTVNAILPGQPTATAKSDAGGIARIEQIAKGKAEVSSVKTEKEDDVWMLVSVE